MLTVIFGTVDFATVLTPVQLIVLALVSMLYIPCIAVILMPASEFGWKKARAICAAEIVMAIFLGGIVYRMRSLAI